MTEVINGCAEDLAMEQFPHLRAPSPAAEILNPIQGIARRVGNSSVLEASWCSPLDFSSRLELSFSADDDVHDAGASDVL